MTTLISTKAESTYGVGLFWNGTEQRVKKGLEAGCLAPIDTQDRTAYSLEVVQTRADSENLMDYYAEVISKARHDANMKYLYHGAQHKGPGRKKFLTARTIVTKLAAEDGRRSMRMRAS